jgi:hypothetical protein
MTGAAGADALAVELADVAPLGAVEAQPDSTATPSKAIKTRFFMIFL